MPGSRPSFRQISSCLLACASSSECGRVGPHRARVRHRRSEHASGRTRWTRRSGARSRRRRAAFEWRRPRRRASSGGGASGRSAPGADEPHRGHPLPRAQLDLGQVVAEPERGEDVAVEVEVAGDVGAPEAELARRGHDAAQRVGRPDDDRRRRRISGRAGCRRRARTPTGRSAPRRSLEEIQPRAMRNSLARWPGSEVDGREVGEPALGPAAARRASGRGRAPGRLRGSTRSRGAPTSPPSSSSVVPRADRRGRRGTPRPSAVASRTGETSTMRWPASASSLHERGVVGHAAVDAEAGDRRCPESPSAASTRSAPRWATPSSTARTSSGRPVPRVRPSTVPRAPKSHVGVPSPSSAGTYQTSPVVVAAGGDVVRLGRGRDDAEVVAQPFDVGAGGQHDRLDAPGVDAADPPAHDREGSARVRGSRTRAAQGRARGRASPPVPNVILASPVWTHALPEERRLLVAGDPRDRRRARERDRLADHAGRVDDARQHALGDAQQLRARSPTSPSVGARAVR